MKSKRSPRPSKPSAAPKGQAEKGEKVHRKPVEEIRKVAIRVMVTPDESAVLKAAAKKARLTLSSWLRIKGLEAAEA
jgi:hypothetical protein